MQNIVERCAVVTCLGLARSRGLCATHYQHLWIAGVNFEQLLGLHGMLSQCAVPGCRARGTEIDHDNRCCDQRNLNRARRCGFCNRGLVCRAHNSAIRDVERYGRIVDPPIRKYLRAFDPVHVP